MGNAKKKFGWKAPNWLENPKPEMIVFHDAQVEAYRGIVAIEDVKLWRGNDRTLLDLEHIQNELGERNQAEISDDKIINYIIREGLHKIPDLAKSVKENGVRVPLVLTSERVLLDGNRRFLACKFLLKREKEKKDTFLYAPVYCLKPNISKELELKIIAEMNFLPDFKEEWPREVRAKFVTEIFKRFKREFGEENAFKKIDFELDVNRADVLRFKRVLGMIGAYVARQKTATKRQQAEIFGREKFHFFEEFYNKALSKKDSRRDKAIIKEYADIFYRYLENDELNSTNRVRNFAYMLGTTQSKVMLKAGTENYEEAWATYEDIVLSKKAASRIERFCRWLEGLAKVERDEIEGSLVRRLFKILKKFKKS